MNDAKYLKRNGWFKFYSDDFWRHKTMQGNLAGCDTETAVRLTKQGRYK